jgi:hypothetical protein
MQSKWLYSVVANAQNYWYSLVQIKINIKFAIKIVKNI